MYLEFPKSLRQARIGFQARTGAAYLVTFTLTGYLNQGRPEMETKVEVHDLDADPHNRPLVPFEPNPQLLGFIVDDLFAFPTARMPSSQGFEDFVLSGLKKEASNGPA